MKRSELKCCWPSCQEPPDWIIYFHPRFSPDESSATPALFTSENY